MIRLLEAIANLGRDHLQSGQMRRPAASAAVALVLAGAAAGAQAPQKHVDPSCTLVRPGFVSGRWTALGSPYCVTGDITVSESHGSGSLTIEGGVEVRVAPGAEMRVTGTLVVQGDAGAPVLFTSAHPASPWAGLFFDGAQDGSSLAHAQIRNASESGIRILDSVVALIACEISDNVGSSAHEGGGGIWASIASGDLVLQSCRITSNTTASPGNGGGLWVSIGSGDLVLEDCVVSDNLAFSGTTGPIRGNGGGISAELLDGRLVLERCELERNRAIQADASQSGGGGAIECFTATEVVLTDCLIAQNECKSTNFLSGLEFESSGGGLRVAGPSLRLTRCVVRDNRANPNYWLPSAGGGFPEAYGGGVHHWGPSADLTIESCVFAGNITWATGENATLRGGAIWAGGRSASITNSTIARNQQVRAAGTASSPQPQPGAGIHVQGTTMATIVNSIVSRNTAAAAVGEPPNFPPKPLTGAAVLQGPAAGPQITGMPAARYSNVEGGFPGVGNLWVEPLFAGGGTSCGAVELSPGSECIDAGDPAPAFDDVAFPPSQGTNRNDMGANGGPLAAGWANWERASLELVLTPRPTPCSAANVLALTKGGALAHPVEIYLEAIDGVQLPGGPMLLASGSFCSAGQWEITLVLVGACEASSFTLRSYALDSTGQPVMSNAVNW